MPGRITGVQVDKGLRSEEHTSELQSPCNIVCRLLLEKKTQVSRMNLYIPFPFTLTGTRMSGPAPPAGLNFVFPLLVTTVMGVIVYCAIVGYSFWEHAN